MLDALQTWIAIRDALGKPGCKLRASIYDTLEFSVADFREILHWALHNQRDANALIRAIDELPGPVEIVRIVQTCLACPSEWDGWDADGIRYYFRYRYGKLLVEKCVADESEVTIYRQEHGDGGDGVMAYDNLRWNLRDTVILPDTCEGEG